MIPVLFTCLSATLLFCSIWIFVKLTKTFTEFKRCRSALSSLPGLETHWLWGNIKQYPGPNEKGLKFHRDNMGLFPRAFVFWLGPFIPVVSLWHPDTIKVIMKTSEPKAHTFYGLAIPWIGDGLLLGGGNKWARNRRLLTPAFHFEILKPYIDIKNRAAEILVNKVADHACKQEYFDICPLAALFTLDVILQCACSYKSDCQIIGKGHPYVASIDKLSELIVTRSLKPLMHFDFLYSWTKDGRDFKRHCDYVHQVSTEIINNRRKMLDNDHDDRIEEKETKRYLDFLDILLTARDNEGIGLTDSEIRDEVDTLLFAGHDTTASALYWTLFSFAGHPEHQTRVQKELDEILKDRHSGDIQWEDLQKMYHLTMCLKEAIRLHTPVPFAERELTQTLDVDGVTVLPGAVVEINIYGIHHNPLVWDEPMKYRPERFAPENNDERNPFAFIPFSAGPRNCIGQTFAMNELKVILAKILYRFNLDLDPSHGVEKKVALVMRAQGGIMIKAQPRTPCH